MLARMAVSFTTTSDAPMPDSPSLYVTKVAQTEGCVSHLLHADKMLTMSLEVIQDACEA